MSRIVEVAVLGAGIAGSSLAKALADKGWETVLIDRQQFPRHKVCGEFLSPESGGMLKAFGLYESIASLRPSRIQRVRLIFTHGDTIEIPLPGTALGVSRFALDTALHHAAMRSGVHVHTAATVTSVNAEADAGSDKMEYVIETKRDTEHQAYKARAVIAAWGANRRSGLQGYSPGHFASGKNSYIGIKSHFQGIVMEPVVELYFFSGGYLGLSPIEDGFVNAAALLRRDAFNQSEKSILGMIAAAASGNPKLRSKLAQAVPVPQTQKAVAPVALTRKPIAWDSMPLVGDAALMIPPLCGDGMSMALRSAQLCASFADSYLRGEISLSRWQAEYTQAIQEEFKGPLLWGRLLQWLFGMPVFPQLLTGLAQHAPGLAAGLVRATRLHHPD